MGSCSSRPSADAPPARPGGVADTSTKPSVTARAFSLAARALSASASAVSLDKFSSVDGDAPAPPPPRPPKAPPPLTGKGAYRLGRTLGTGGFSVVRLATRLADGARFAAKVVPLPPDDGGRAPLKPRPRRASCSGGGAGGAGVPSTRAEIIREIQIHAKLSHPNVVRLVDHYEDRSAGGEFWVECVWEWCVWEWPALGRASARPTLASRNSHRFFFQKTVGVPPTHPPAVIFIQELLEGGELLDSLLAADGGAYTEATAAACVAQVASALAYLHAQGVLHRDVKLDNVLLASPGDLSTLKLADFGLSNTAAAAVTVCGTPAYAAPEVVAAAGRRAAAAARGGTPRAAVTNAPPPPTDARPYGAAADNWSLGVVTFLLLAGHPPFYADTDAQLYRRVVAGDADWDDPIWHTISDTGRSFVKALLDVNPATRMTAADALRHPWLAAAVAPSLETRPSAALAMRRAASLVASRGGPGRAASLPPPQPAEDGLGLAVASPPRAVGGVRAAVAVAAPADSGRRIKAAGASGEGTDAPPLSAFAKVAQVALADGEEGGDKA